MLTTRAHRGLHPTDIDSATVGDIVRFIKKSHRFSTSIQWQLESHRGWLMDPYWRLSLRGDATNALPLLEPGTWNPYVYIFHFLTPLCLFTVPFSLGSD